MKIQNIIKIATLAFLGLSFNLSAQDITNSDLQDIRNSYSNDAQSKAIQNILTENANIKSMALNRELQGQIDHYFKYRVDVKGITNQKSSGRCWMFTSMNVLRPSIMEKYNLSSFDFSHNYLFFWDLFEKSNLFLENIINTSKDAIDDRMVVELFKSPVGDGGVWNLYYNAAEKYGVVPKEVMPETAHSDNTSQMRGILNEYLRTGGYKLREMAASKANTEKLRDAKKETLKGVYRILALCLGEPPTQFTWRYKDKNGNIQELKDYTPQQFYREITPADYSPENYIMIMNDPTREYYKVYEIQNYRNTIEGVNWIYLNLPNEDIKKAALASIKNNEAMYASCDVGKQFNSKDGISDPAMYDYESLFGIKLDMDKKARILTRQSGSSHAMTLIACDTDENDQPVKWEFENSWGATSGHNGYLTFTDKWFDEYMFRLVVHRRYLDTKAINSLKQKPIQLPMWDYMN
jgi:bleomycin hydrolase